MFIFFLFSFTTPPHYPQPMKLQCHSFATLKRLLTSFPSSSLTPPHRGVFFYYKHSLKEKIVPPMRSPISPSNRVIEQSTEQPFSPFYLPELPSFALSNFKFVVLFFFFFFLIKQLVVNSKKIGGSAAGQNGLKKQKLACFL